MSEPRPSLLRRLSRPRLSLRLTMAAVLIVAVVLGWVITGARRQAETVEMVRRLGGEVQYDWDHRGDKPFLAPGPRWLTDIVGPDYNHDVTLIDLRSVTGGVDDSWADRLAELHHLESLSLGDSPSFTSAGLARLSGLDRMEALHLSGTGVSGGAFVHLKGMTRLMRFSALGVPTLDADLANFSGLTDLKSLVFQGDRLTDAGLAHLRPLKNLESLQIASDGPMQITSTGLAHLSGMARLWQLVLVSTKVESLEPLRGLTSFKGLGLAGARLDDQSLAPLANFTHLEVLSLMGKEERFGDAGLAYIAGLKSIENLWLTDTKVGDAGLSHLAGMSKLELLNLDGTRVTDAGLAQLANFPKLKTLSLNRTAITDAGLAQLSGLAACQEMSLKETRVSPAGIDALKAKLPTVQIVQ